jgi:hypothetical protein
MAESGAERTENATPKRLEEARKKGQVPRSTELSIAAVCVSAAAALYTLGRGAAGQFAELMRGSRESHQRGVVETAWAGRDQRNVDQVSFDRFVQLGRLQAVMGDREVGALQTGSRPGRRWCNLEVEVPSARPVGAGGLARASPSAGGLAHRLGARG